MNFFCFFRKNRLSGRGLAAAALKTVSPVRNASLRFLFTSAGFPGKNCSDFLRFREIFPLFFRLSAVRSGRRKRAVSADRHSSPHIQVEYITCRSQKPLKIRSISKNHEKNLAVACEESDPDRIGAMIRILPS